MKCFFDFMDACSGPVTPSATKNPTHGYCAVHRTAELERAQWDDDKSTSRRAGRANLSQSKLSFKTNKQRRAA